MTKDSILQGIFINGSVSNNLDSVGSDFVITGGAAFGSGMGDAFILGALFKKHTLPRNVAIPYVYKSGGFHIKMPDVYFVGAWRSVPVARIFKDGKWNTLTGNIDMIHESCNQIFPVVSIADNFDSISQTVTMGV